MFKLSLILAFLSLASALSMVLDNNISPAFNTYNDIHMNLYTRSHPKQAKRIQLNSVAQLRESSFNPLHPTRVLIHGMHSSGNANEIVLMRDAYLSVGDFNVFVVDYELGAADDFEIARYRVGPVGQHVALFLDFLKKTLGNAFSFESVTVVGHSMGCDVSGFVGRSVRMGRITKMVVLDPKSWANYQETPEKRVEKSDADYVESIHSDIDLMGSAAPIGHAAFYPTFGRQQPGCQSIPECDHMRAVEFFAESVKNPLAFYGTRCASFESILKQSCPSMGEGKFMGGEPLVPLKGESGVFYLTVNAKSPFGKGR